MHHEIKTLTADREKLSSTLTSAQRDKDLLTLDKHRLEKQLDHEMKHNDHLQGLVQKMEIDKQ